MALSFGKPDVCDEPPEGLYVRLQDASKEVEARISVMALKGRRGLTKKSILDAFGQCRARAEVVANRKYDAGDYKHEPGKRVIWIRAGEL